MYRLLYHRRVDLSQGDLSSTSTVTAPPRRPQPISIWAEVTITVQGHAVSRLRQLARWTLFGSSLALATVSFVTQAVVISSEPAQSWLRVGIAHGSIIVTYSGTRTPPRLGGSSTRDLALEAAADAYSYTIKAWVGAEAALPKRPKGPRRYRENAPDVRWKEEIATEYDNLIARRGVLGCFGYLSSTRGFGAAFRLSTIWVIIFSLVPWAKQWNWYGLKRRRVAMGECIKCGYPLLGLSTSRCPECGGSRN